MSELTEFLLARIAEDEKTADLDEDIGHISRQGYVRALAECEAKRTLVLELDRMERDEMGWDGIEDKVMCYLAMPHADHPDYREDWHV